MTIPELAKQLYEKFGSWSKAARALNISDTALYAWRDGRTIPGFNFVDQIAQALAVSRDEVRNALILAHEVRDARGRPHLILSGMTKPGAKVTTSRLHRGAVRHAMAV
jgi:DNA-binding transcriptional regulator YdaS (Cro superfamily)